MVYTPRYCAGYHINYGLADQTIKRIYKVKIINFRL